MTLAADIMPSDAEGGGRGERREPGVDEEGDQLHHDREHRRRRAEEHLRQAPEHRRAHRRARASSPRRPPCACASLRSSGSPAAKRRHGIARITTGASSSSKPPDDAVGERASRSSPTRYCASGTNTIVPTPTAEKAMPIAVDSRVAVPAREQRRARHHAVQADAEADQHADQEVELPQADQPAGEEERRAEAQRCPAP